MAESSLTEASLAQEQPTESPEKGVETEKSIAIPVPDGVAPERESESVAQEVITEELRETSINENQAEAREEEETVDTEFGGFTNGEEDHNIGETIIGEKEAPMVDTRENEPEARQHPTEFDNVLEALQQTVKQDIQEDKAPADMVTDEQTESPTSVSADIIDASSMNMQDSRPQSPANSVDIPASEGTAADAESAHQGSENIDVDAHGDWMLATSKIKFKDVKANTLSPRDQEVEDELMVKAVNYFFNNKFAEAGELLSAKATTDPLYALGLGAMAFMKGIMTMHEGHILLAIDALTETYSLAKLQVNATQPKRPISAAVSDYFSNYYTYWTAGKHDLPSTPRAHSPSDKDPEPFLPNGVLRAETIKAECCLLISILQLAQESVMGYVKAGLNLRRAYTSYTLVWQQYKRMGQNFEEYMDKDTVSGIQFGIGSIHLLLSCMPAKAMKIINSLGWKTDKNLGFALLKLALESRRVRSPLASMMLLAYYTVLMSFAPQVLSQENVQSAIEALLDAQHHYQNSSYFLYFAGRTARLAKNLTLSNQSFGYATDISKKGWAEVEVGQICQYEIGFNNAMQLDWNGALACFESLYENKYWSPAFQKYAAGACYLMLGNQGSAILCFAEIPKLVVKKFGGRMIAIEQFVLRRVQFYQKSGYQDLDLSLPALELLYIWNLFQFMEPERLHTCLQIVEDTMKQVQEREHLESEVRMRELAPDAPPPDYFKQRASLFLIKASIQNTLERYDDSITQLNWIMDHKEQVKEDAWILPFTFCKWEAGVTTWGLKQHVKARKFWDAALEYKKYEFEYRLAIRLHLAISKCEDMGIQKTPPVKESKGLSTGGRKRMSIIGA